MDGRNAAIMKRDFPEDRSPTVVRREVLHERVQPDAVWLDR